jgi:serralysin
MCQLCSMLGMQDSGGFGCSDASAGAINSPDGNFELASATPAYSPPPAATSVNQGATGNPYIDGLLIGTKWNGSFTYSFPQSTSQYQSGYTGELSTFNAVTFQQREATRAILSGTTFSDSTTNVMRLTSVNSFIAPSVSEAGGIGNGLNGTGDIRLGESNSAAPTAYGYYPNNNANGNGGDVWFSTNYAGTTNDYRNPYLGGYAYMTHIHELGHAMGLKHAHETGGVSNVAVPTDRDAIEFTVMSYRSYVGGPSTGGYTFGQFDAPQTYMQYDILALQTLYGAYYGTNSGNTVYTWSPTTGETFVNGVSQGTPGGNKVFLTIWDGGGNDTYDFSNYTTNLNIDLNPGGWINLGTQIANLGNNHTANGNIYNAFMVNGDVRSLIENANGGSGNDVITGNQAANILHGNGGNDFITGTGNSDIGHGDAGNDQLFFVGDQNQLFGDDGNDWLGVNGNNNALYGGAGDDSWIGASGIGNTLDGQDGNDALFAYGTSNTLLGRVGNDWLGVSGNANALYGGDNTDWIGATGTGNYLIGGNGDDTLLAIGNNNSLYGEAGGDWVGVSGNNNLLSGGAGADYLAATGAHNVLDGGADNDILFAAAGAHDHDLFEFLPGYGLDLAFNFTGAAGDKINIQGWGISNYSALTPYLTDTADGLVIAFNAANQLTLKGVHAIDPSWVIYS